MFHNAFSVLLKLYSHQYECTRPKHRLVLHKLTYEKLQRPSIDKIVQADWLRSSFAQNSHHVPQQRSLYEEILVASYETYVTMQLQILAKYSIGDIKKDT